MIPTPEELEARRHANPVVAQKYPYIVYDDSYVEVEILKVSREEADDLRDQLPEGWTIERLDD